MKQTFVFLLALLAAIGTPMSASAAIQGAPFLPEMDARFNAIEQTYQANPQVGVGGQAIARAVYSVPLMGGVSGSVYSLGVSLPKGALITRSYFHISSAFLGAGGHVEVYCPEAGYMPSDFDIIPATVLVGMGADTMHDGSQTGSSSAFSGSATKLLPAACVLSTKVTTTTQTAGQLEVFVNYTVVK